MNKIYDFLFTIQPPHFTYEILKREYFTYEILKRDLNLTYILYRDIEDRLWDPILVQFENEVAMLIMSQLRGMTAIYGRD